MENSNKPARSTGRVRYGMGLHWRFFDQEMDGTVPFAAGGDAIFTRTCSLCMGITNEMDRGAS
jgi:hypothetical protein